MSTIENSLHPIPPLTTVAGPQGPSAAPVPLAPAGATDKRDGGLALISSQLRLGFQQLDKAVKAGDTQAVKAALDKLDTQVQAGLQLSAGTQYQAGFEQTQRMLATVRQHLPAEPVTQLVAVPVGLRGATRMVEVAARPEPAHKGMLGWLGKATDALDGALSAVGHVVFFPLELAGKALDPVRAGVGAALGGLRTAIDNSLGKVPVLGLGVRFTTGLANSVVGLVGGALQGITHPVALVKGLLSLAWTIASIVPPTAALRVGWDMAVNGKDLRTSYTDALGDGKALARGFFGNALEAYQQKNYAGMLGQLTGDIGSFFVGGAGVARVVGVGGRAANFARVAEAGAVAGKASRLARVGAAGGKVVAAGRGAIALGLDTSGRIFSLGLKGNWAVWNGVRQITNRVPGLQRVMPLADGTIARLKARFQSPRAQASSSSYSAKSRYGSRPTGARAVGTGHRTAPPSAPVARPRPLSNAAGLTFGRRHLQVVVTNPETGRAETTGVLARAADGTYQVKASGRMLSLSMDEILAQNPKLKAVDFWEFGGSTNVLALRGLRGRVRGREGTEVNLPNAAGVQGRLFGRTPDGDLVVERPAGRAPLDVPTAEAIPLEDLLGANPGLLVGSRLGQLEGHTLVVGEYQPATQSYQLALEAPDGTLRDAGRRSLQQLASKLGESKALAHLPEAKVGVDGRGHLLDDPVMGIGEVGVPDLALAGPLRAWFTHDQALQETVHQRLAADPKFTAALKHWGQLSKDEKLALANRVSAEQGAVYGFTPARIETVGEFPGHPDRLGVYHHGKNELIVLEKRLGDPARFLETVFHEQLHAYQWQLADRFKAGQIAKTDPLYTIAKVWADNYGGYIQPRIDSDLYRNQPVEAHAFQGGARFEAFVHDVTKPQPSLAERIRRAVGI